MANPWDNDPVIGANPWDADPVVAPAPKRSGRPDFGNVQSGFSTTGRRVLSQRSRMAQARAEGEAAQAQAEYDRMQMGGNGIQQALIGAGDALTTLYRGPKQMATDQALRTAATASMGLRGIGMDSASGLIDRYVGAPLLGASEAARADEAQRRADTENMAGSIPAQVGKIAAYGGTALAPGVLARGTGLAPVLLPNTIRGNAAIGAAYGAIQPYTSEADQAFNAGTGAALGGVFSAVPAAARTFFGPKVSAVEQKAAAPIIEAIGGRDAIPSLQIEQSAVPGVRRSLGEATLNPQIMALERNARRLNPAAFAEVDAANNLARVNALRGIAGDEASMAAAKSQREAASGPFYAAAGPKVAPLDDGLKTALGRLPNGVLAKAKELAQMSGESIPDNPYQMTGANLHYIKLALDDAIGRSTDGALGNTERAIAMRVKENLTDNIGRLIPEYAQAMQAHASMSPPINRMQAGSEILKRSTAALPDPVTGVEQILPASYGRAMKNLDQIVQRSTGFNKATAKGTFTPEQLKTYGAIGEDMARIARRQTNPAQPGSATMEASELTKRALAKSLLSRAPVLGPLVEGYDQMMTRAISEKAAQIMANPAEAQRILNALAPAEREAVKQALMVMGQTTSSKKTTERLSGL